METKTYEFIKNGGQEIIDGKTEWPDYLHLSMTRNDVLETIESLSRVLRVQNSDIITVSMLGKLLVDDSD